MRIGQGDRRGGRNDLAFLLFKKDSPGGDDPLVQVFVPALAFRPAGARSAVPSSGASGRRSPAPRGPCPAGIARPEAVPDVVPR